MSEEAVYAGKLGTLIGAEQAFEICARQADEMAAEARQRGMVEGAIMLQAFANATRTTSEHWLADARAKLNAS